MSDDSDTELPVDIDIDLSELRGEDTCVVSEKLLATQKGVERMRWFVRAFKKKEGAEAWDKLFQELVESFGGEDFDQ